MDGNIGKFENPLEKRKKMTLFEALAPGRLLMARRSADGGLRLADGRRRPLDVWDAKKGRLLHEFYEYRL